jgi:hypothetical protein
MYRHDGHDLLMSGMFFHVIDFSLPPFLGFSSFLFFFLRVISARHLLSSGCFEHFLTYFYF